MGMENGSPVEGNLDNLKYFYGRGIHADILDVVANIDHVVKLAGIDYVGLGSDFDDVGGKLPNGLKNVSCYPNLIFELMKNGYTEEDIKKICSDNFFLVWSDAERTAVLRKN
jgi:membrane dipeptidase